MDRMARKTIPPGVCWGAILAGGVTAYALIAEVVLRPLHAHELAQALTGVLNGVDQLLQGPGLSLAQFLVPNGDHRTTRLAWLCGLGINVPLYGAAGLLLRTLGTRFAGCWRPLVAALAVPPAKHPLASAATRTGLSRRGFLLAGAHAVGASAAAGLGYGLQAESRWYVVSRRRIHLRDLPPALDGIRAVHLTDIHHGPWLSREDVRQVVAVANELRPDLVLLTGDYVQSSAAYARPVVEELARLEPRFGTVAVLGNHDWWDNPQLLRREFARAGIRVLDNARCVLTPEGRLVTEASEGLALCGVGDLWEDRPDFPLALGGLPAALPRVLLAHNPDAAEEPALLRSDLRVDLMVSGHTHGGQVRLPLLGTPIIPSRYGSKYAQGLIQGPVCPVFVSRGIGTSQMPVRLGVTPEIALLELRRR
jgi:predicted MPP superfamily phosphohydrolase